MARVALVTGGMGGLGEAVCFKLSALGYCVVTTYSPGNPKVEQRLAMTRDMGFNLRAYACDVADYDPAQACIAKIEAEMGPVDVLVNNAGITRDMTFKKMDKPNWDAVMATNLDSVFNMTKPVCDGMVERGWGRIINISSVNGQKGAFGQTNYSAAKAGMHGFTKALALEVARKGVTVNTISPGYIGTKMVMEIPQDVLDTKIIPQIPMARLGKPEEVAGLVAYLVSDEAAFVTGANIAINGGQHMSLAAAAPAKPDPVRAGSGFFSPRNGAPAAFLLPRGRRYNHRSTTEDDHAGYPHAPVPAHRAEPPRHARRRRAAHDILGGGRPPGRRAGDLPARRTRRRRVAAAPPLLRPATLPRDPVRPARRRQVDAAGRVPRQHHPAADRRHRNAARAVRRRALAGVRRVVGFDAGARLRPGPSRALPRLRAARDFPVHAGRDRLVPPRRAMVLSRAVRRLHRADTGSRARRPAASLRAPHHERRPGRLLAGRARLEQLRGPPRVPAAAAGGSAIRRARPWHRPA